MIMPVASKRKTPASLEAVDATFSPTFFDESLILFMEDGACPTILLER
jgi:hypothetical protein